MNNILFSTSRQDKQSAFSFLKKNKNCSGCEAANKTAATQEDFSEGNQLTSLLPFIMKVQGVKFLEVFSLFFFSFSFYSTPTFLPSLFPPCFYFDNVNFQHNYNLTFTMDKFHVSCDLLFHLVACKNSSSLPPLFLDEYDVL